MKALVYPAWDHLEVRDVPEPAPRPGEVVVRVAAVGICGSELEGRRARVFRELVTAPPEDYIKAVLLP